LVGTEPPFDINGLVSDEQKRLIDVLPTQVEVDRDIGQSQ
jgi:hypothetical protein